MSGRHSGVLEAVDRIVNRGGDAHAVLRDVVRALHERGYERVEVAFLDESGRALEGARAGEGEATVSFVVALGGSAVGELRLAGADADDRPVLERVATLISPYVSAGAEAARDPRPR